MRGFRFNFRVRVLGRGERCDGENGWAVAVVVVVVVRAERGGEEVAPRGDGGEGRHCEEKVVRVRRRL